MNILTPLPAHPVLNPSRLGFRYGFHRPSIANMMMRPLFKAAPGLIFDPAYDNRTLQRKHFNQLDEGSCTANSVDGEVAAIYRLLGIGPDVDFSRQLTYALEREQQGSALTDDSGSSISMSCTVVEQFGVAPETDWPYDKAHFAMQPTPEILAEAAKLKNLRGSMVNNDRASFKATILAKRGVLLGFTVFESFENDQNMTTGIMSLPQDGEQILGGHAVRAIGWDDNKQGPGWTGAYRMFNSWGEDVMDGGDFWMPYVFAHDLGYASDFHRLDPV